MEGVCWGVGVKGGWGEGWSSKAGCQIKVGCWLSMVKAACSQALEQASRGVHPVHGLLGECE